MPTFWVIAPYHYDYPDVWQNVWSHNLKHGFLSLGWRWMGNVTGLTKQQISKRYATRDPDAPAGRVSSDSAMLFKFHNEIAIGDVVVARGGRKSISAIGSVTRTAYYDTHKAESAFPKNEAYPNHIDVDWDAEPRDVSFDSQVFGLMALHKTTREKLDELMRPGRFKVQNTYPDDLADDGSFPEGALRTTTVNAYERSRGARIECLNCHGYRCAVCDMCFAEQYGEIGLNFIHVHHLNPLAAKKREYTVDARKDLIPVCPNCHAMMHTSDPRDIVES